MKKIIGLVLGGLFFVTEANALEFGAGVKAGSTGVGIDLSVVLTKTVNARLSLTSFDIDGQDETVDVGDDSNEGEIDAELDFDYGATALLFDWYVFDGSFHITAGAFKNNGRADLTGNLVDDAVIDGQLIEAGDLIGGGVSGSLSLGESFQPYLGIGWGRKAGDKPGLSVTVDLGVALLDPEVKLEAQLSGASVNFADQAELDATLRNAESDAEDELDDFKLFPVASIGVNYAF